MCTQGCIVSVLFFVKGAVVFVPPLFKGPRCQTSIMFCVVLVGDTSYINHIVLLTFWGGQRAGEGPILAVAAFYLSSFVLCLLTRLPMLGIHLYPILTVFLFRIFLSGLFCGNEVSIILKNCFPMFVFTAEFHGGLNQVSFLFLFLLFLGLGGSSVAQYTSLCV